MNYNYVLVSVQWYHKSRWDKCTYIKKNFYFIEHVGIASIKNILDVMLEKFTLIYIILVKRNIRDIPKLF